MTVTTPPLCYKTTSWQYFIENTLINQTHCRLTCRNIICTTLRLFYRGLKTLVLLYMGNSMTGVLISFSLIHQVLNDVKIVIVVFYPAGHAIKQ